MIFLNHKVKLKKGFTLIELIFVIVILGVLASVSLSLIFNVYHNYISQKALSNLTQKTDILSSILANHIYRRIKGTIITKEYSNPSNFILLDTNKTSAKYNVLEWIGYDYDSFSSNETMSWSGIANYTTVKKNSSKEIYFDTPASNLNNLSLILEKLSNNKISLKKNKSAGIIFKQKNNLFNATEEYNPKCMGLITSSDKSCIFAVYSKSTNNQRLYFEDNRTHKGRYITERYQLSWTAYSIHIENITGTSSKLYFYYNYQPWNGDMMTSVKSSRKLLAENVSVFKYIKTSDIIQLKICLQENLGDRSISACKIRSIP